MASNGEASGGARATPEWDRLELGVRRLLDAHARWRDRAMDAEGKVRELEAKLAASMASGLDPAELAAEIGRLEQANRDLVARLEAARGSVHTLLDRLELMEEDR